MSPTQVPTSTADRAHLLDRTRWTRGLSFGQVQALARYLVRRDAEAGDVVVCEGDSADFFCILVEGRVQIVKAAPGGDTVVGHLGPGSSFGEMAVLDGEPRSASVIAMDRTVLLVLTRDALTRLERDLPRLAMELYRRLARTLSRQLRRTSGMLVAASGT